MATQIFLPPESVWQYSQEHAAELQTQEKLLAYDPDSRTRIQLCMEEDIPTVYVFQGSSIVAVHELEDADDTVGTLRWLYGDFFDDAEIADETDQEQEEAELIESREEELDDAAYDFLTVILGELLDFDSRETQEILEDIKDTVLPMLYEKHQITTYRPMYLADATGTQEFTLYPYPDLV